MTDRHEDWFPLDPEQHERQIAALRRLPVGGRILDLGCGDGRVLVPLVESGHRVVGVDWDGLALDACRAQLPDANVELLEADIFSGDWPARFEGAFETILCLGNTFLLLHDTSRAGRFMRSVRALLMPGGVFHIDALCHELWREVAEGFWQTGVSEDGSMQLIWQPGDNVIALRHGGEVMPDDDTIRPADRLYRIWSLGEIALLCELSGFDGPIVDTQAHLIGMTRP
ncbi:MAG: class I SAM-dependent methyltransferase [Phycisphaerales bacterium]|nr:class I SAM-dependent methyltransferase [Phycisphaerales bacterium]